jgi:CBS domain-containing protein
MLVERIVPKARERLAAVSVDAAVREAAGLMSTPHIDLVIVCAPDGRMVGVLTKTDIVGQIRSCDGYGCTTRVEAIMTRDVVSCRSGERLQDVWSAMKEQGLQRVPIIDQDGKPVGIIYARDALQILLGEAESEEALLRDYVMCVGYH